MVGKELHGAVIEQRVGMGTQEKVVTEFCPRRSGGELMQGLTVGLLGLLLVAHRAVQTGLNEVARLGGTVLREEVIAIDAMLGKGIHPEGIIHGNGLLPR